MIEEYLKELERSSGQILAEMEAEAKAKNFPIIGPQCGRRLMILAKALGATKVFEMGSGYGYSTVWFGHAVGSAGIVTHTDGDIANTRRAQEYVDRSGFADRVRFLTGDAIELLKNDGDIYDVVLIDIDKEDYPKALDTAVTKLRVGGLILTHNTKWSNRVADPSENEPTTVGIREYNRKSFSHPELLTYIDPVDDGLGISLKVSRDFRSSVPVL